MKLDLSNKNNLVFVFNFLGDFFGFSFSYNACI